MRAVRITSLPNLKKVLKKFFFVRFPLTLKQGIKIIYKHPMISNHSSGWISCLHVTKTIIGKQLSVYVLKAIQVKQLKIERLLNVPIGHLIQLY